MINVDMKTYGKVSAIHKNVSNIYSLIDLVMGREGGRCYCSLCDDRSLYYYVVYLFHMMSLSG